MGAVDNPFSNGQAESQNPRCFQYERCGSPESLKSHRAAAVLVMPYYHLRLKRTVFSSYDIKEMVVTSSRISSSTHTDELLNHCGILST